MSRKKLISAYISVGQTLKAAMCTSSTKDS